MTFFCCRMFHVVLYGAYICILCAVVHDVQVGRPCCMFVVFNRCPSSCVLFGDSTDVTTWPVMPTKQNTLFVCLFVFFWLFFTPLLFCFTANLSLGDRNTCHCSPCENFYWLSLNLKVFPLGWLRHILHVYFVHFNLYMYVWKERKKKVIIW